MIKKTINYNKINNFKFKIQYAEVNSDSQSNVYAHHIHEECEIYINVSGDVSFMVENRIYPIQPGSIIITRPYEFHHCIYNGDALHRHFWILFSVNGNEKIFETFFNRSKGDNNLFVLAPSDAKKCFDLCFDLCKEDNCFKQYYNFFSLINLINSSNSGVEERYTRDMTLAINYINENIGKSISVSELSAEAFVSVNTLERHFLKYTGLTPVKYIRAKRLSNAAMLLNKGTSVSEAAVKSGFNDYSHFIQLFKKYYGVTPLKYINR